MSRAEPPRDCRVCERLITFREQNAQAHPEWFNAPVPSFGAESARVLIVGLAPGLQGANKTGRPFTGDYAGDLLYATLEKFGLSQGTYGADPNDGLSLPDCIITCERAPGLVGTLQARRQTDNQNARALRSE